MLFSPTKNFIFIHVKKTAGTSVLDVLRPYCIPHDYFRQHITAKLLKTIFQNWSSIFSFGFVRNPFDWVVSYYEYIKQAGEIGYDRHPKFSLVKNLTFDEFVRAGIEGQIHEFIPQKTFLYKDDVQIVSFVGKFESLQEDFDKICQKIAIPRQKLPHKKKTARRSLKDYYLNQETVDLVVEHFGPDFDTFNYNKVIET